MTATASSAVHGPCVPCPWDLGINLAADILLWAHESLGQAKRLILCSQACVESAQAQLLSHRGCTGWDPCPQLVPTTSADPCAAVVDSAWSWWSSSALMSYGRCW